MEIAIIAGIYVSSMLVYLQSFNDGLKLLSKEGGIFTGIMILIVFILLLWSIISWITDIYCINYSILIIFVLIRLRGSIILIIGWRSDLVFSFQ